MWNKSLVFVSKSITDPNELLPAATWSGDTHLHYDPSIVHYTHSDPKYGIERPVAHLHEGYLPMSEAHGYLSKHPEANNSLWRGLTEDELYRMHGLGYLEGEKGLYDKETPPLTYGHGIEGIHHALAQATPTTAVNSVEYGQQTSRPNLDRFREPTYIVQFKKPTGTNVSGDKVSVEGRMGTGNILSVHRTHPAYAYRREGKFEPSRVSPASIERAFDTKDVSEIYKAVELSEAQKEAGNYKKEHIDFQGLDISIENKKGSTRSGTDRHGKTWSVKMHNDYGYIKGTVGKDKDQVDVFIGDYKNSKHVFIIDQKNQAGEFDEHKCMLGFLLPDDAYKAYMSNYGKGWTGYAGMSEMSMDAFKAWLKGGGASNPSTPMDEKKLVFVNKATMEAEESGDADVTHVSDDKSHHILRTRQKNRTDGTPCDFGKIVNRKTGGSSKERSIGHFLVHADGHGWKQVKGFE